MTDRGDIIALASGEFVLITKSDQTPFHTARILWAPATSSYPRGGHDISISDRDIAESRTIRITDELSAHLFAASEPAFEHGWVNVGDTFTTATGYELERWEVTGIRGVTIDVRNLDTGVPDVFDWGKVQSARMVTSIAERGGPFSNPKRRVTPVEG